MRGWMGLTQQHRHRTKKFQSKFLRNIASVVFIRNDAIQIIYNLRMSIVEDKCKCKSYRGKYRRSILV